MNNFGKRLEKLRKKNGYSQKKIAELIGVSASTYRDWEYGKQIKGEPYVDLAHVLNVSVYRLITGEKSNGSVLLEELNELENRIKNIKKIASSF